MEKSWSKMLVPWEKSRPVMESIISFIRYRETRGRIPRTRTMTPERIEYTGDACHTNFNARSMRMAFLSLIFKGFVMIRPDYTPKQKKRQEGLATSCLLKE